MLKPSLATKFPNFFSDHQIKQQAVLQETTTLTTSKSRRSYSNLNLIRNKQVTESRITQYLTNRKLGLITKDNTKQIKQLKNYQQGNKQISSILELLKQVKQQLDECVKNCKLASQESERKITKAQSYKKSISQLTDSNRFTQENAIIKSEELKRLSESIEFNKFQSEIFTQMKYRTKEINNQLKSKVNQLRNQLRIKNFQSQKLDKLASLNQNTIEKQKNATTEFKLSIKRSSLEINHNLKLAKQTIQSKSHLLKLAKDNQQIRDGAAKQYQLRYLNDKRQKRQLYANLFLKRILETNYMRVQEKSAPLVFAFSKIKNRTAIVDVTEFKNAFFQSGNTRVSLIEKIKQLEERQNTLTIKNKELVEKFMERVLEYDYSQQSILYYDYKTDQPINHLLVQKNQHMRRTLKTLAKITMWCSKMNIKLIEPDKRLENQNSQTIKDIIAILRNFLFNKF